MYVYVLDVYVYKFSRLMWEYKDSWVYRLLALALINIIHI